MDGTMIDNSAYHRKALQTFLKQHGITLTEEDFKKRLHGKKNDQAFRLIFGEELTQDETKKYAERKETIYREIYAPFIKEIDGLKSIIELLHKKNIKTAVATTAPFENREFVLEALDMRGKFEVIVGDEHVINGKPDPEIYLSTAKQLGVLPKECIVFEDSLPGVEAGKNAGMTVVGILSSHTTDELNKADYIVKDFKEITFV